MLKMHQNTFFDPTGTLGLKVLKIWIENSVQQIWVL